ncbi:MAG TPA: hypothetical protein VN903_34975 [Polyangia bacterium]|nr:hypothetical protein [Polyangia bacterium]
MKLTPTNLQTANNSWRFPADNPQGDLCIDKDVEVRLAINRMAEHPEFLAVACYAADWQDECRAAALGG